MAATGPEDDWLAFAGPQDGDPELVVEWHCITGRVTFTVRVEQGEVDLSVSVPMSLKNLITLRDKMIDPAIAFAQALEQSKE